MAAAKSELASVDGVISPAGEATIAVTDEGLLRGDGVFEVLRLYEGRPFAYTEHLDRLERSAAGIELEVEREPLELEIAALLAASTLTEGQLRLVITRGGRRIAITEELPARGATVAVATVTYAATVILTGVKTLSYAANMQATRIAEGKGADEAILVRPDGIVLEAPTASLFWVDPEDRLRTPEIGVGILESITRARVVRELHIEEGTFTTADLEEAQEAFLASTTREVQPISSIDGRELEAPGPRTREAIGAFSGVLEKELWA